MAIQKKKTTKDEVSTEINLKELLGGISSDRDIREAFFQVALDRMEQRLDEGRDVNERLFPKYSKEYKDSLAFAAFGKDSTVDMRLTGDMRAAVKIISQDGSKIKVGINDDNAPKAYNHQVGDTLPKREWFGWTDKELKDIAKEFRPVIDEGPSVSDVQITNLLDRLLGESDEG